ncbi:MAG: L,D-transpeptidase [Rhodothermales bacterium]|nr:L,D-transpeptidase [Rhodothermales bacterium]MBO6781568.1 L,D-transpeptidase [Rhodothermales bacterium]
MRFRFPLLLLLALATALPASGQYINQRALAEILSPCSPRVTELPEVNYEYFILYSSRNNSVLARNTFYKVIGDGDLQLGRKRAKLVGMLNRKLIERAEVGDTLVVPSRFDLEFCAYTPFPKFYQGGADFDKLFVIDKSVQAWAAYENGRLARWGIVNTGGEITPTPTGRFNFNWKTEYRVSSMSPPGEPWEMYWVFNFHEGRGIHIHQYPMPTGGPSSHGCVRLVEEDAKWIYDWGDTWVTSAGSGMVSSANVRVIEPGTTVLVIGEDPVGDPQPFHERARYPILNRVILPGNPYDVPPGTRQQEMFDRVRRGD